MSLKIITFANHKGGVSKTTSTASIGACMARMGNKPSSYIDLITAWSFMAVT